MILKNVQRVTTIDTIFCLGSILNFHNPLGLWAHHLSNLIRVFLVQLIQFILLHFYLYFLSFHFLFILFCLIFILLFVVGLQLSTFYQHLNPSIPKPHPTKTPTPQPKPHYLKPHNLTKHTTFTSPIPQTFSLKFTLIIQPLSLIALSLPAPYSSPQPSQFSTSDPIYV